MKSYVKPVVEVNEFINNSNIANGLEGWLNNAQLDESNITTRVVDFMAHS